eukprot:TRINITY_DN11452_c0_g1_i1.p1 TRINITY_DN11452_c0_g1~~TRINITY_DN11452_c0_g1_i1.p1  ORF type:complete len:896 (+),score=280.53 TRINITY_DN11452_c0_g1_i1:91-2778(+)
MTHVIPTLCVAESGLRDFSSQAYESAIVEELIHEAQRRMPKPLSDYWPVPDSEEDLKQQRLGLPRPTQEIMQMARDGDARALAAARLWQIAAPAAREDAEKEKQPTPRHADSFLRSKAAGLPEGWGEAEMEKYMNGWLDAGHRRSDVIRGAWAAALCAGCAATVAHDPVPSPAHAEHAEDGETAAGWAAAWSDRALEERMQGLVQLPPSRLINWKHFISRAAPAEPIAPPADTDIRTVCALLRPLASRHPVAQVVYGCMLERLTVCGRPWLLEWLMWDGRKLRREVTRHWCWSVGVSMAPPQKLYDTAMSIFGTRAAAELVVDMRELTRRRAQQMRRLRGACVALRERGEQKSALVELPKAIRQAQEYGSAIESARLYMLAMELYRDLTRSAPSGAQQSRYAASAATYAKKALDAYRVVGGTDGFEGVFLAARALAELALGQLDQSEALRWWSAMCNLSDAQQLRQQLLSPEAEQRLRAPARRPAFAAPCGAAVSVIQSSDMRRALGYPDQAPLRRMLTSDFIIQTGEVAAAIVEFCAVHGRWTGEKLLDVLIYRLREAREQAVLRAPSNKVGHFLEYVDRVYPETREMDMPCQMLLDRNGIHTTDDMWYMTPKERRRLLSISLGLDDSVTMYIISALHKLEEEPSRARHNRLRSALACLLMLRGETAADGYWQEVSDLGGPIRSHPHNLSDLAVARAVLGCKRGMEQLRVENCSAHGASILHRGSLPADQQALDAGPTYKDLRRLACQTRACWALAHTDEYAQVISVLPTSVPEVHALPPPHLGVAHLQSSLYQRRLGELRKSVMRHMEWQIEAKPTEEDELRKRREMVRNLGRFPVFTNPREEVIIDQEEAKACEYEPGGIADLVFPEPGNLFNRIPILHVLAYLEPRARFGR